MIFRAVEDADLIARVRRGDVEAFNLLVSRWEKRVFNYLLRLTGKHGGLSRSVPGRVSEGLAEHSEARRRGAVRTLAVPHRSQRGVFAVPQTASPEVGMEDATFFEREPAPGVAPELSLAVNAALDRLNAGAAGSGGSEGLSGF